MNPHGSRAFAPGRVNLIGEHTDYNLGLCLPFAVARGVTVTAELRDGAEIVAPGLPDEDPYLRGAVTELRAAGVTLPGCTLTVDSDLPQEAGLSSSAALCVSLVLALTAIGGAQALAPIELAELCQRIENEYTGVETGLLDQLASILGEEGQAVRLDMRTLESRPVALDLGDHVLAVLDSGSSRSLAESGYNERLAECERAAGLLGVESLRDATDWFGLPDPLDRRVRHVVTENERVDAAVAALEARDLERLGELLDGSHRSLRDDYEVSVPEVERAVDACREAGALGARIMGGGFGGSVLALFPPGAEAPPAALPVRPAHGARLAVC
jgi:galactokinase